jgi:peptide-methionine (S)-S-oxide reductase
MRNVLIPLVALLTVACSGGSEAQVQRSAPAGTQLKTAIFGGGCFWCVEEAFDKAEGVVSTTSGYTGGRVANPTYEQVSSGGTGHVEVVQVVYDPARVNYQQLLNVFWKNVDPLTPNRQFCDRGPQYRSAIFYQDAEQRRLAEAYKRALEQSGRFKQPIVTEVVAASRFYPAEEYHQNYYQKNPLRYKYYKTSCGRVRRLEEVWGKS